MFGSIIGILSALSGVAAGVGKKVKQVNESDMERGQPQSFDAFDALGVTSDMLGMARRAGFRKYDMRNG